MLVLHAWKYVIETTIWFSSLVAYFLLHRRKTVITLLGCVFYKEEAEMEFFIFLCILVPNFQWNVNATRDVAVYVQPENVTAKIPNGGLCVGDAAATKAPFLLVIVCSAVSNTDARNAIRDTWMKAKRVQNGTLLSALENITLGVKVAFLLGETTNETIQNDVYLENELHGDIIQEGFYDSYLNLTLKSVMLLKWVTTYCPEVSFVLKTDDDMFVNIPALVGYLSTIHRQNVIVGYLFCHARPVKDLRSKWLVQLNLIWFDFPFFALRWCDLFSFCIQVLSSVYVWREGISRLCEWNGLRDEWENCTCSVRKCPASAAFSFGRHFHHRNGGAEDENSSGKLQPVQLPETATRQPLSVPEDYHIAWPNTLRNEDRLAAGQQRDARLFSREITKNRRCQNENMQESQKSRGKESSHSERPSRMKWNQRCQVSFVIPRSLIKPILSAASIVDAYSWRNENRGPGRRL